jgi:hypothetical protein
MKSSSIFFVGVVSFIFEQAHSFAPVNTFSKAYSRLQVQTEDTLVEVVEGDDRVLDVASFRNGLVNPEMMVERAQAKRDAIDTKKEALDGLKIGLLYIGPVVAAGTYFESKDLIQALTNYGKKQFGGYPWLI